MGVAVLQRMTDKPCFIGEGPVWRAHDRRLYFVNPQDREIGRLCLDNGTVEWLPVDEPASSLAFTTDGRMLVATHHGVWYREDNGSLTPLSDEASRIRYANDGKVGPDGALYVGTQSSKRMRLSDEIDGRLYRIDPTGSVAVLLDGLILSNGLDWSPDGTILYHTDSDTNRIREYTFDITTGNIRFTGRQVLVDGVDGLTVDADGRLFAACWGKRHLACIDPVTLAVTSYIDTPCTIPASCCFAGQDLKDLIIVSADYHRVDNGIEGYVYRHRMPSAGKEPYLFG